jgi:gluconokinase
MVLILMGVSGSGKTTIGRLLADRLKWDYADADDYHSPENRSKMRKGIPLTDEDRASWLDALGQLIAKYRERQESLILACSALREAYRARLGVDQQFIRTVYLKGDREELAGRLSRRKHPFFDPQLLDSQLEALEEPDSGLILSTNLRQPEELVDEIIQWLKL